MAARTVGLHCCAGWGDGVAEAICGEVLSFALASRALTVHGVGACPIGRVAAVGRVRRKT